MKRFKKLISCLLVLCIVAAVFPVTVHAASNGQCGDNATWSYSKGTLTITGTGDLWDYDFEETYPSWFELDYDDIEKIVVSDGITSIGMNNFFYLYNVTDVVLGKDVTSIGDYAFEDCYGIETFTIPSTITHIGQGAFHGCAYEGIFVEEGNRYFSSEDGILYNKDKTTLIRMRGSYGGSYTIPKSVTSIDAYAFASTSVSSVTIPSTVTSIGEYAFYFCFELEKVTIPGSVKTISEGAFSNCYNLENVTICNGVRTIGEAAFEESYSLSKIEIPGSVTTIGKYAFSDSMVEKIYFCGDAPTIKSNAFFWVDAKAYYPSGNSTWTSKVRKDYGGDLSWSSYTPKSPSAPEIKASNVSSSGKNKISWSSVKNAAEYRVYRATSKSGTYSLKDTVTGTSFTDSTAKAGKTYYYYVVAVGANGLASGKSNIVSRTCDLARPEVTLSNVASSGKVKVSWEAISGAAKYEVYRATSKDGTYSRMKTTTGTSFTNTSAVAGKTYYYKFKAIAENSAANSAYSSVKSRTCDLARPEITLSNVASSGKIKVSWEKVDGAVKYEVRRSTTKDGEYTLMKTTTGTSFTNTSAVAGQTYYYKVKAIAEKSSADSAFTSAKSRTCDLARPVAEVVLNDEGKPVVTWAAVSGAEAYTLYISDASGAVIQTVDIADVTYTHAEAVAGETYTYQVMAVHAKTAANSAKSEQVSIESL